MVTTAANLPKLLTTEQAAEVLGLKPATLVAWRHHGRYPLAFTRAGLAIRYPAAAVLDFIERRTVNSQPAELA